MDLENNLREIQKSFYEYDLTDSIIEELYFDNGLVNFNMLVDYYFTEKGEEHIELTFEDCTKVNYEIPPEIHKMNTGILNFSHFTIIKTVVTESDNQVWIKIFTIGSETEFLNILCKNVKFKSVTKL